MRGDCGPSTWLRRPLSYSKLIHAGESLGISVSKACQQSRYCQRDRLGKARCKTLPGRGIEREADEFQIVRHQKRFNLGQRHAVLLDVEQQIAAVVCRVEIGDAGERF